jgi:hypothetical protein
MTDRLGAPTVGYSVYWLRRALLPSAIIFAAAYILARSWILPIALGAVREGGWIYTAGLAAISWSDTGFARRELQGTLIRLFTDDPMVGLGWFGFATYSVFAAAGIWACLRPSHSLGRKALLGVALLAILMRLSYDVGRTDAAVMALGIGAAWSAREARWMICATFLFVALLFHEAGLIELAPLVVGIAVVSGSWRQWRSLDAAGGARDHRPCPRKLRPVVSPGLRLAHPRPPHPLALSGPVLR